ncbi:YdcF family protein [Chitinolyticbacter albus]|uniref:YdcF family protein n=1 Tax=Chitinolyticbacter albus TaxID=2961951 RepID=UPI00210A2B68|nr:YdcF family protein [Chitinolyticbacter albus]
MPAYGSWGTRMRLLLGSLLALDGLAWCLSGKLNVGTLLPLALGLGLIAPVLLARRWQAWLGRAAWRSRAWRAAWWIGLIWLITLLLFFWHLARQQTTQLPQAPAAIVVLGSGLNGSQPAPMLQLRLDETLQWAKRYPAAAIVVSGGQGLSEDISEAAAMRQYLAGQGIAQARILEENRSTSTEENLLFSHRVLGTRGLAADTLPVLVVSSDFHVWRARRIAKRQGYGKVMTAGAPTPLLVRYNAWLREYFAVAISWTLGEF